MMIKNKYDVSLWMCLEGKRINFKDEFFDTIRVDFEGRKVPVFRSYDKYLTSLYKDYMTPPPIEKRNSGHDLRNVKFDKEN